MEVNKNRKTITISQNTGITVSVALIVMFTGALFTVATYFSDQRHRLTVVENNHTGIRNDITKLQTESTDARIKYTEIQTQLKSIDTTLLEIKERLR